MERSGAWLPVLSLGLSSTAFLMAALTALLNPSSAGSRPLIELRNARESVSASGSAPYLPAPRYTASSTAVSRCAAVACSILAVRAAGSGGAASLSSSLTRPRALPSSCTISVRASSAAAFFAVVRAFADSPLAAFSSFWSRAIVASGLSSPGFFAVAFGFGFSPFAASSSWPSPSPAPPVPSPSWSPASSPSSPVSSVPESESPPSPPSAYNHGSKGPVAYGWSHPGWGRARVRCCIVHSWCA